MRNFGTLYRFELKKILCTRLTVIVLIGMFVLTLGLNAAEYIAGSKLVTDADAVLVGRELDDAMFDEMRGAIDAQTAVGETGETVITSASVRDKTYSRLWTFLKLVSRNDSRAYQMTRSTLEKTFNETIDDNLEKQYLTDSERSYWVTRWAQQTIPPVYGREGGWGNSLVNLYMENFLIVITIGATLAGVFSSEYTLRTDALVFSSGNGKRRLAVVKLLAGCTVGFAEAVFLIGVGTFIQFLIYGNVDADTSIQFYYGPLLLDMPAKRALILSIGILLLISIFYSAFVMCLSQLFRNPTVPMAAMALVMLLSMLNPPDRFRIPAQIAAYMPATFPGNWTFTDYRLLTLFGAQFNILQVLPVLYVLLTVLLLGILRFSYKRVQIGGR